MSVPATWEVVVAQVPSPEPLPAASIPQANTPPFQVNLSVVSWHSTRPAPKIAPDTVSAVEEA